MTEKKKIPIISKFTIILIILMMLTTILTMFLGTRYFKNKYLSEKKRYSDGIFGYDIGIKKEFDYLNKMDGLECFALLNDEEFKKLNMNDKNTYIVTKCLAKIKQKMIDSPVVLNEISNMKEARANPYTILLDDGRVLIIDGNKGKYASAEIFNPETKQFKLITKNVYRYIPEGFRCKYFIEGLYKLPNGKIFFLGAIFDPKTDTFNLPEGKYALDLIEYDTKISSLKDNNKNQIIKIFNDGKVLWSKGCKAKVNNNPATYYGCTEVFLEDPFNPDSFVMGKLNIGRARFESIKTQNHFLLDENKELIKLPDNKLLITDGQMLEDNNITVPKVDELYDPLTGEVIVLNQNSELLESLEIDNQPYLYKTIWKLEGVPISKYQIFNQQTKQFKDNIKVLSKPSGCYNFKNLYLVWIFDEIAIVLDLKNKKIHRLPNPNLHAHYQSVTTLKNGDLLILGGFFGDSVPDSFEARSKFAAIISIKDTQQTND